MLRFRFSYSLRDASIVRVETLQPTERRRAASNCDTAITPTCLQVLYHIPTIAIASSNATLAVSGGLEENANKADLEEFLKEFRPDLNSSLTFSTTLIDGAVNSQNRSQVGGEAVSFGASFWTLYLLRTS